MKSAPALLALYALSAAATSAPYTIHHRVHHATLPHLPYRPCGVINIADDDFVSFEPSSSLLEDLATFSDAISGLDGPLDNLYYQLALQRGDAEQTSWDFSFVKACHLSQATSQTFVLHTHDAKPFAMDYFVSPIQPDGSCPKAASRSKLDISTLSPFASFAQNVRGLNTTILFKTPHVPPLPELRKPQPVAPTGQPIQPVSEKTFIQKYWMYIAVAFVALLLTGSEEEGPRRQARA